MLGIGIVCRNVILATALFIAGCPYTVTGHLWSVNAYLAPRAIHDIRANVLALGGGEGPINVVANSMCLDGKYYEKTLLGSGARVRVNDCYRKSNVSDTGWVYSVSVVSYDVNLGQEVRKEIEELVEEIQRVLQDAVGNARVITREMEMGYGFSLLPY